MKNESLTSNEKTLRITLGHIRERAFRLARITCDGTCSDGHPLCDILRLADTALASSPETTAEPSPLTLRDFGYAPGGYTCRCFSCGETFTGDKRAGQCEPCARKKLAQSQVKTSAPLDPTHQAALDGAAYRMEQLNDG